MANCSNERATQKLSSAASRCVNFLIQMPFYHLKGHNWVFVPTQSYLRPGDNTNVGFGIVCLRDTARSRGDDSCLPSRSAGGKPRRRKTSGAKVEERDAMRGKPADNQLDGDTAN